MKSLTMSELITRFGTSVACRVWYKNQKTSIEYYHISEINRHHWKNIVKIKILFEKCKWYNIDGDACKRDGACFLIKE